MREKDYYGAIKGFCLKWNLPEVWNSDRITGANLIYEVIKVINAMILEQKEVKEMQMELEKVERYLGREIERKQSLGKNRNDFGLE